jgi:hypothetical protein
MGNSRSNRVTSRAYAHQNAQSLREMHAPIAHTLALAQIAGCHTGVARCSGSRGAFASGQQTLVVRRAALAHRVLLPTRNRGLNVEVRFRLSPIAIPAT